MIHYILLSLYAAGLSFGSYFHDITPRLALRNQSFLNNTQNIFSVAVPQDLYATGILSIMTEITVFKFLDFGIGTRGWYGKHSFQAGGMYWLVEARATKNIKIGFRHDSIHAFDNAYNAFLPRSAKAWSQDKIYVMFHYNFDDSGKSNLMKMLFKI